MADKQRIKGITCCGDCVYYNWKKHKCSRGASVETDARSHFYDDCPIPDVEQLDIQEIRNKAIDEFAENLKRKILEEIYDVSDRQKNYEVGSDMSMTCSHIMGTLRDVRHRIIDEVAEQMKGGGNND